MSKIAVNVNTILAVSEHNKTKAVASVVCNDAIQINNVRIVQGSNGPFVSMPQQKDATNVYRPLVYIKDQDLRKEIESAVLEAYKQELSKMNEEASSMKLSHGENEEINANVPDFDDVIEQG